MMVFFCEWGAHCPNVVEPRPMKSMTYKEHQIHQNTIHVKNQIRTMLVQYNNSLVQ